MWDMEAVNYQEDKNKESQSLEQSSASQESFFLMKQPPPLTAETKDSFNKPSIKSQKEEQQLPSLIESAQ